MKLRSHRRGTRERLIDDLHAVVEDGEALLKASSNEGSEKIDDVRKQIERSIRTARERIARLEDDALSQASDASRKARTLVRENSLTSVGIALVVGFLVGIAIDRD